MRGSGVLEARVVLLRMLVQTWYVSREEVGRR